jgi:hypothetical protein
MLTHSMRFTQFLDMAIVDAEHTLTGTICTLYPLNVV